MSERIEVDWPNYGWKYLPGGRLAVIDPLLLGRARINVGPDDAPFYTEGW